VDTSTNRSRDRRGDGESDRGGDSGVRSGDAFVRMLPQEMLAHMSPIRLLLILAAVSLKSGRLWYTWAVAMEARHRLLHVGTLLQRHEALDWFSRGQYRRQRHSNSRCRCLF
jgi:hypothetical protein